MVNIVEIQFDPVAHVDQLVDMTCDAFPMYVPILPYLGSLRIDEVEHFQELEEIGGVELAKFDLRRGIVLSIKFNATYDISYFKYVQRIRDDHKILRSILDPVLYSYPNEEQGNEPTAQLSLMFDGQQVQVAGTVIPCFVDQDNIQYCEVLSLANALFLFELVYDFTGVATDNGYRLLN